MAVKGLRLNPTHHTHCARLVPLTSTGKDGEQFVVVVVVVEVEGLGELDLLHHAPVVLVVVVLVHLRGAVLVGDVTVHVYLKGVGHHRQGRLVGGRWHIQQTASTCTTRP